MNRTRSKWIRKLFIDEDPGLILSLGKVYEENQKKVNPRSLYRRAKSMWNRHDPATKTWGKLNIEKSKKGVTNGR